MNKLALVMNKLASFWNSIPHPVQAMIMLFFGAASEIFVMPTVSEGSELGVTCNPAADTGLTAPRLLSKSAGSGFTINLGTFSSNPMCFDYFVVN